MGKITRLPGMEYMSGSEYKAFIKGERKAYRRRLRMICPSKEMRKAAKNKSYGLEACPNCVYYDKNGGSETCRYPHTDAYMEALKVDSCYEGILLKSCKEMERQQEEIGNELKITRNMAYETLETLETVTRVMINVAEKNELISPVMADGLRSIRETVRDIMDSWEHEEDDDWDFDIDDDDSI